MNTDKNGEPQAVGLNVRDQADLPTLRVAFVRAIERADEHVRARGVYDSTCGTCVRLRTHAENEANRLMPVLVEPLLDLADRLAAQEVKHILDLAEAEGRGPIHYKEKGPNAICGTYLRKHSRRTTDFTAVTCEDCLDALDFLGYY